MTTRSDPPATGLLGLAEFFARERVRRDHADELAAGTTRVNDGSALAVTQSAILSYQAEDRRGLRVTAGMEPALLCSAAHY